MTHRGNHGIGKSAAVLLARVARREAGTGRASKPSAASAAVKALLAADLAQVAPSGALEITDAGRAHLTRAALARVGAGIDPFTGQHLVLAPGEVDSDQGRARVAVDLTESPLAWLARRKGRDGRPLIEPVQLQAGERLRADFTRAQLMPRVTANWTAAVAQDGQRGARGMALTDAVVAARQRVRRAFDQVGPEFTGLLIDVCCFLKGLEDVERERGWPRSSAKVVLQLGLDRLARHYGYGVEARGAARAPVRTWLADDAQFALGE